MPRPFCLLLSLVVVCLLTSTACGSQFEDMPAAVSGAVPQYLMYGERLAILPNSAGKAELYIPDGEAFLAFFPVTSNSGDYGFSITGMTETVMSVDVPAETHSDAEPAVDLEDAVDGDEDGVRMTPRASFSTVTQPTFRSLNGLPQSRTFQAPAGRGKKTFISVEATKVVEGEHVALYSQEINPLVTDLAQSLVDYVDGVVIPGQTALFGPIPDVDGNGKVVLLLTDVVNNFSSDPGAFTGGFFATKDILGSKASNNADMLYLYLPRSRDNGGAYDHIDDYKHLLSEIIVHELQHMISFWGRHQQGERRADESWLSEGLSHWAEGHFGFDRSNKIRARHFLKAPQQTGLVGKGQNLAERGAAYLFVKFLVETHGHEAGFLRKLMQTNLRGVANVEHATGKPFDQLLREWSTQLYETQGKTLHVQALTEELGFEAKAANSAPTFLKVRGPARLYLSTDPAGHFQGVGRLLKPVATTSLGEDEGAVATTEQPRMDEQPGADLMPD